MSNPPSPIRFALVGAGHIGWRHAAQMQRCGQLTAMADIVPEKAAGLAQAFGAMAYPSLDALLSVEGMEPPALAASRPANEYGAYSGSMSNHDKVYDELVKALRQESYDLASAVEAEQTVLLIEKIKQWQSTSSI